MHSFKLAAGLQHTLPNNPNPLLILVNKKAGHGRQSTQQKFVLCPRYECFSLNAYFFHLSTRIRESVDKWAFVVQSLGLVWKDV